jgi:lysylphosphatidylglycerol synthetase-like protein (DUF2156 family)
MKKSIARLLIIASCVVPAVDAWLLNFVAEPSLVSPSLSDAYNQIGVGPIVSASLFTLIGMLQIAALAWLAWWRVGKESIWRWERAYSLWSTVKWCLLLAAVSIVMMRFAAFAIPTKIGRLVPSYYDQAPSELSSPFSPWQLLTGVGLPVSLLMFLVSAVVVVSLKLRAIQHRRRLA